MSDKGAKSGTGTDTSGYHTLSLITSTSIEWWHTTEHEGVIAIRTSNQDIHGWLWPKSEAVRPIIFSLACLAVSSGKQLRVRYKSFDGTGFRDAEVIDLV